ncbi:CDP-diacylglycerol--glycerol-3-phosphate 3-phosphatidyltransferase [Nannocystis radixulma]|uniref:CDP-diacylglycerol--glycerol-3-phosphate 3-phosphatidyltransferase n=1 Tax=Nannocystis radixulma TaxID=2995305 RepID=A0ABT5BIF8_9BACT|nr:CDP-diacylglycerol--glycerol-3-phosphate 3-phosphatidyltransferase [Nannocystis radixulma]MCY1062506.1 CDP-diacylglycerol--glycerol-3-phosphate 3-phosphatidyltransferase [Nannocystis sp. SCPEA4]MDC0673918.1 CDP-diacylglycerol--glycerol-3-phosphate 3-phosphatidyltransferase [Nannocystis radixulma]
MKRYEGFRREILNLPNMITIGRVFLIPPVLMLIDKTDPWRCVLASLLFTVASLLDLIDGWLARRSGLVTVFGKFVDPLADKIMVAAVLVYLVMDDRAPAWLVVLLLTREFYINGLRSLASSENIIIAASAGGKAKTAFQLTGISFLLMHYRYRLPGIEEALDFNRVGLVLLGLSVFVSIISAVDYTFGFREALAQKNAE